MREVKRSGVSVGSTALVLAFVLLVMIAPASAIADEEILVLSSKHLGMTGDEIAESESRPEAEATAAASEWRSDHSETAAAACPTAVASQSTVFVFEGCVEAAIRGGNGYGESSRVCRALFPEQTATLHSGTDGTAIQ